MKRIEPRAYDVNFHVNLSTLLPRNVEYQRNYELTDAPIVMPVIFMGTYSRVESDSVKGQLWLNTREVQPRRELKKGLPFGTQLATTFVDQFKGTAVQWEVSFRGQVWSSLIDDAQAASIAWPREWPDEVQDGLKPQRFIESDDPVFAQTVERVTQGRVRMVPPYLAARELVRYSINEVRNTRSGMERWESGAIKGLVVQGAKSTAESQMGSPHDLVCVCVAMLRAAGIPARPVIGIVEDEESERTKFVSWAEFYLPETGWVPFDPDVMRGKGIRNLDVRRPWPEFGTMDDLNRRIPLSYHFVPPVTAETPHHPALWGWDPRPGGDPGSVQEITVRITSRGKGVEDPE